MSRLLRLLALLLTFAVLMACQRGGAPTPTPPPLPTTAPQPEKPGEILIGAVYPLSGSLASTGVDLRQGVELAVEIVNGSYDLDLPLARTEGLPNLNGAKIKVTFGDHEGDPEKGASEAERLITEEKVVALIGSYNSAVTATASQTAERYGVPFLNPESTSPTLTERGFQWFFRTTPDDRLFAENFFQFLNEVKEKGLPMGDIVIVNENTLWGTDVAKFEQQFAEQYGYKVLEQIPYDAKATDVTSEVQRIKAHGRPIVMQASYVSDAILYMRTYKQLDVNPLAILAMDAGFIASEFIQTVGEDAEYILSREVWSLDLATTKPIVKAVNDLYRERYGADMNGNSARAFTGMLVLADAINRAGSTDPAAIQKALLETDIPADQIIMPWEGVRFSSATHQNVLGRGIIVQILEGKYRLVWPFELAAAELVWPMPTWDER